MLLLLEFIEFLNSLFVTLADVFNFYLISEGPTDKYFPY